MGLFTDSISKLTLADALSSIELKGAIERIAGQNYQNAPVLLEQEYAKNNEIFFYQDADGVQGYFMVGWSLIACGSGKQDSVFLGLSSVSPLQKGKGIGGKLYRAFITDAREWEARTGRSLVWWFHTASPVVARSWWNIASEIAPERDGRLSDELLAMLQCILSTYGMSKYSSEEFPFLLRGYAKARYAASEVERLESLRCEGSNDLLTRLQVNERDGDRLLFVGRVPQIF